MIKTINTPVASDVVFTSAINVQGHQRINVSIRPGTSLVTDPTLSVVSATFTLQRQLPGDPTDVWRGVQDWAVTNADGLEGEIEVITTSPEPETAQYRLGVKEGNYDSGAAWVRLGTS